MLGGAPEGTLALAIGDDTTDEDLFLAAAPAGIVIRVSPRGPIGGLRFRSWRETRRFLSELADRRASGTPTGEEIAHVGGVS